jgi:hypothetical protein
MIPFYRKNQKPAAITAGSIKTQYLSYATTAIAVLCYDESAINIALCHHPENWLHTSECIKYSSETGNREVTWDYISNRVHMVFSGHLEGENTFQPRPNGKRAYTIIGGATFYSPEHAHSFNIISLNEEQRSFEYYAFQYTNNKWSLVINPDSNRYSLLANENVPIKKTPKVSLFPTMQFALDKLPITVYNNLIVIIRFFKVQDTTEICIKTKVRIESNNRHIKLDNGVDLQRHLKFEMLFDKSDISKSNINITLPEEMYGSVEATLFREKLFSYVSYGCNYEIANNGIAFASGTIATNSEMLTDAKQLALLEKINRIQEFYNVKIDLPEEFYEFDAKAVNELIKIMENGCIHKLVGTEIHFSISNKIFKEFVLDYESKRSFYGEAKGDFNFRIGNTIIPVGNRTIVFTNMEILDYKRVLEKSKILDLEDDISIKAKTKDTGETIIIYESYTTITLDDIAGEFPILEMNCIIDYSF